MTPKIYLFYNDNSLQLAVEFMLKTEQGVLPIVDRVTKEVIGIITEHDILKAFEQRFPEEKRKQKHISMSSTTIRVIQRGRGLFAWKTRKIIVTEKYHYDA